MIFMCVCVCVCVCVGASDREREQDQGVNVDDGTETVGTMDQLVHQTTPLHVHLGPYLSHTFES